MERLYRLVFLGLFVIGFIGVAVSADRESLKNFQISDSQSGNSLIQDLRMAQGVNNMNAGRWNQDIQDTNTDSLARIEAILADGATDKVPKRH